MQDSENQIVIYETADGKARVEVRFENETAWLTQAQMAELFETTVPNINQHIKNVYSEGELEKIPTIKKYLIVQKEGNREIRREVDHYNLDVIISIGYRVKSLSGTQFRIWATQRLKEYIIKGFTLDDVRLKQGGHRSRYFEELLQRIRDIRSSERMLYQKVTDIYITAIDYRKNAKETDLFFKTVQNKLHYAVTGKTAAELIAERADNTKQQMGLTNYPGFHPIERDIYIAKNYLNEKELIKLNDIVDAYLSFAEIQAKDERAMTMKQWIQKLDEFMKLLGKGILHHAGSVSAENAEAIAKREYEAYRHTQDKNLESDFDKAMKKYLKKPNHGT